MSVTQTQCVYFRHNIRGSSLDSNPITLSQHCYCTAQLTLSVALSLSRQYYITFTFKLKVYGSRQEANHNDVRRVRWLVDICINMRCPIKAPDTTSTHQLIARCVALFSSETKMRTRPRNVQASMTNQANVKIIQSYYYKSILKHHCST